MSDRSEADEALEAAATARSGTALLVRRPILAFVLNALIVLAGLGALMGADVRELPDVDRPVVSVNTDFDGAAPETIDREITAAVEGAAGRVAGVKSISSSSRFGSEPGDGGVPRRCRSGRRRDRPARRRGPHPQQPAR